MKTQTPPYVVVLAGGDGTRLCSLTRALYGIDLPKQFAVLDGERSLLQRTIERALALTTEDRISVVVTANQQAIAREQLAAYPLVDLVVQPRNLDTAPGILLPLARIVARAPSARVIVLPSDHYIADPAPIRGALEGTWSPLLREQITVIGVAPTSAEPEYGWIVPGRAIGDTGALWVEAFREKPRAEVAAQLREHGGLWNTFVFTAEAGVLWNRARELLPHHVRALEVYAGAIGQPDEADALLLAYRDMQPANFSREVLARTEELAVIPVRGSGWADWGSPSRVFETLAGTPSHARLLQRIRGEIKVAS
ncbi:MAG TPA: sugar phosphate nucleotidyltransferase [Kofleriaceae bacterium]|jgi:mannose-1-phosphate guanylyltransferase